MAISPGFVSAIWCLPTPWPPRELVSLYRRMVEGCTVEVFADATGRLGLSVGYGKEAKLHMFQPILLSDGGMSTIDFGWSEAGAWIRFRGVELIEDPAGNAAPIFFDMTAAPKRLAPARIYGDVEPARILDHDARFFLETLVDIDDKLVSGDRYQLIRAAGLMRQLVLDGGSSLLAVINRQHRLKLRFSVMDPNQYPPKVEIEIWSFWRDLDPSTFPDGRIVDVDLDQLLQAKVLWHSKTWATVRDVIKACANAKGGVHLGRPEGAGQEILLAFDQEGGSAVEPSLGALAGLCRVILKGLEPLVRAIIAP